MHISGRRICALATCAILAITLAACKGGEQETATQPSAPSPNDTAAIQEALTHPNRFAEDAEQDAWRKPAAVLQFVNVKPGATVLDYFAAGGYYTELLAHLVGPSGHVIAYNNAPYLAYAGNTPVERYANNRLSNVTQLTVPPEELALEPASIDTILFVDSYHDLYWRPKDNSWPAIDPRAALAKLLPALKPGGTVVVVDHVAAPGGDTSAVVDKLHRIDPNVVERDFAAAGLTFDDESTALQNPADDHTKAASDPAIRHKTDHLIYKFRKPTS